MKNILLPLVLAVCLLSIWLASNKISPQYKQAIIPNEITQTDQQQDLSINQIVDIPETESIIKPDSSLKKITSEIVSLLNAHDYYQAIEYYNSVFDSLNNKEIERIEILFLQHASALIAQKDNHYAEQLLINFIDYHNENPQFLFLLAEIYIAQNKLEDTIQILVRARNAEIHFDQQKRIELRIAQVADIYRRQLENALQFNKIISLYEDLYNSYPNNHDFVLQLALAYVANQQPEMALPYFQQLLNNEKYGDIAKNAINEIYAENKPEPQIPIRSQQQSKYDIAIAMQPYGDQFLIETRLNGRPITLLLDTGASITSLTLNALKKINAKPLGEFIQLNTANGQTQSQLYQLSSIQVGNVKIKDLVVAEVNMNAVGVIQGLLGTDFLKHFHYSINNQNSTLYLNHR